MSSEAITQNDLREILSRTVGAVPSEYKKLLWTNPNPTSAFNAQTIPLDLSNYDAIEIIIRADTANTYTIAPIITEVGKGGIAFNSTAYNSVRQFTTTTSGITFTGATYHSAYGNWSTTSTNALIPVKIYGIKYERVAPPQVEYPNYSTEEQEVGTFIDGKTIYRKSKLYTWSGTVTYDNTFFQGISVDRIVRQRTQITKNATYAQESFYWSSADYNRCWIVLSNNPPTVSFSCSQSAGCEILITVDYTKA